MKIQFEPDLDQTNLKIGIEMLQNQDRANRKIQNSTISISNNHFKKLKSKSLEEYLIHRIYSI